MVVFDKVQKDIDGFQEQEPSSSPEGPVTSVGYDKPYVVLQVTLTDINHGTGSDNLYRLENVINKQAAKGYRLHTISTANGGHGMGPGSGDIILATLVFEKL